MPPIGDFFPWVILFVFCKPHTQAAPLCPCRPHRPRRGRPPAERSERGPPGGCPLRHPHVDLAEDRAGDFGKLFVEHVVGTFVDLQAEGRAQGRRGLWPCTPTPPLLGGSRAQRPAKWQRPACLSTIYIPLSRPALPAASDPQAPGPLPVAAGGSTGDTSCSSALTAEHS